MMTCPRIPKYCYAQSRVVEGRRWHGSEEEDRRPTHSPTDLVSYRVRSEFEPEWTYREHNGHTAADWL